MTIQFSKFHGAGNDFVIIDDRESVLSTLEPDQLNRMIYQICHRHFGIGADGVMLLTKGEGVDFSMRYFNSDGREGTMCGNGGRCISAYAYIKGIAGKDCSFLAIDGLHKAEIVDVRAGKSHIRLQMKDVSFNGPFTDPMTLDTGSPHYVTFVSNIENMDVNFLGRSIRNSAPYRESGINVNFAEVFSDYIFLRTYERGVENETLACGTGATATAISAYLKGIAQPGKPVNIHTRGGVLKVSFSHLPAECLFSDVWLEGPAEHVFSGEYYYEQSMTSENEI